MGHVDVVGAMLNERVRERERVIGRRLEGE